MLNKQCKKCDEPIQTTVAKEIFLLCVGILIVMGCLSLSNKYKEMVVNPKLCSSVLMGEINSTGMNYQGSMTSYNYDTGSLTVFVRVTKDNKYVMESARSCTRLELRDL